MRFIPFLRICTVFAILLSSPAYAQLRVYSSLLKKSPPGSKYVRPKSTELLALLESEQIDYVFSYRNVAVQHGLNYLPLPAEINLGSTKFADFYKKAKVRLTDGSIKTGETIKVALTIPRNAPNPKISVEFIKLILGQDGKKVLENNGLPFISPAIANNARLVPDDLRGFFDTKDFRQKPKEIESNGKVKLRIFHAGSLTVSFFEFERIFEKRFPNIDVINEPHGSRTAVRQVTDMDRSADLVAVADYTVIKNLMFPKFANWHATFAGNEMVLIYGDHSKSVDEINDKNWHEILLSEDVTFGRSDPNQDPSGYRTMLLWKLADLYYTNRHRPLPSSPETADKPPKRTAVLQIYVDQKLHTDLTRLELDKHASDFSVKGHPVKKGSLLTDFFNKLAIHLEPGDEISLRGRGKASYRYTDLVNDEVGFVLTRMGTAKIVSRKKGRESFIPHVRVIEITKARK